jgi:hypothetical protein
LIVLDGGIIAVVKLVETNNIYLFAGILMMFTALAFLQY